MIIVTGGAGFIGSTVVSYLNEMGRDDIIIVDNLGKSDKWKNLVGKRYFEYIHKEDFIDNISNNNLPHIDAIIHMGACSSTTEVDAEYLYQNNIQYTRILMDWAVGNKVRFIYASSAATYGDGSLGYSDKHEDINNYKPLNMYGYSKQFVDEIALRMGLTDSVCSLRFFNVYGPNEYHKGSMTSVVFNSFNQIQETGKVQLFRSYKEDYADGEQKRDFVYVKDVAKIIWWLLKNPEINGIYNIGTGQARSWNDLARSVFKALNLDPKIEYIDMPEHLQGKYQYFTQADNDKIMNAGWTGAFTSLEDGVEDYVQNYLVKGRRIY